MGRTKGEPLTEKEIEQVEAMAGLGLNYDQISRVLGFSKKTLKRRLISEPELKEAMDKGRARAIANVAKSLYSMATSGKIPAATFFYLKTQARWKEVQTLEHTGEDGKPIESKNEITVTIKDARLK